MKDPKLESNRRFGFWQKWMVIYSILGIVFGLVMAFGSTSVLFQSYNQSVSQAFWGEPDLHEAVSKYHPWIFAVLGSSLTGLFAFSFWHYILSSVKNDGHIFASS